MKHSPNTVFRLLVLAGALTSLGAGANPVVKSYDEGAFYDNLRQIQSWSGHSTTSMQGAQGPIRTEFSTPLFSYEESAFYDNLRMLQDRSKSMDMRGAQGPVRTDYMVQNLSYDEGAFYHNLNETRAGR